MFFPNYFFFCQAGCLYKKHILPVHVDVHETRQDGQPGAASVVSLGAATSASEAGGLCSSVEGAASGAGSGTAEREISRTTTH